MTEPRLGHGSDTIGPCARPSSDRESYAMVRGSRWQGRAIALPTSESSIDAAQVDRTEARPRPSRTSAVASRVWRACTYEHSAEDQAVGALSSDSVPSSSR